MNSLSYGCPELLEGEDDLSNAARAQKQREGAVLCEPTGSEREKKDHNTSPWPAMQLRQPYRPLTRSVLERHAIEP